MSNIRYTDKNQTSITVVVDQLVSGVATYNDINLYVNGSYRVSMQNLSGAGGSSGNYRTGEYTISGLTTNTTYNLEARIRKVAGGSVETISINVTTDSPTVSVGSVNNLNSSSITKNGFSIGWDSALNATSYQILLNGNSYYTSNTYYNFGGLSPETTYSIQVRGYTGSNNGNYTSVMYVKTGGDAPSPLAWTERSMGGNFNLTAKEWNDMTAKINEWRKYQNPSSSVISFPVAYSGNDLTALMFNQAVNAITALNPPYNPAATVSVGETVTAAKINRISDSLDSLI